MELYNELENYTQEGLEFAQDVEQCLFPFLVQAERKREAAFHVIALTLLRFYDLMDGLSPEAAADPLVEPLTALFERAVSAGADPAQVAHIIAREAISMESHQVLKRNLGISLKRRAEPHAEEASAPPPTQTQSLVERLGGFPRVTSAIADPNQSG